MVISNFGGFVLKNNLDPMKRRIAGTMADKKVDPYIVIYEYLDHSSDLLVEGWIGNFFKRIKAAWDAFWTPMQAGVANREITPQERLQTALSALNDLQNLISQNSQASPQDLAMVLRGVEQSVTLLKQVEPVIQKHDAAMQQYAKTGQAAPEEKEDLPEDLEEQFMRIMQERDRLMKEPDSETKMHKLIANDDQLLAFKDHVEEMYQSINPEDQGKAEYKKQIENWLNRLNMDSTFREIENLLDFARKRSSKTSMLSKRPDGYEEVLVAWRKIVGQTTREDQQKQMLQSWYNNLQGNHKLRKFIRGEIIANPSLGQDETSVFMRYADEWVNRFPHSINSRRT